jgi:hypothetical protein
VNLKTFIVFGARRTGTNYLEQILLANFPNNVGNLNKAVPKKLDFINRRPYLFDQLGSKHSIIKNEANLLGNNEYLSIGIIRHPLSWLDARIRYQLRFKEDWDKDIDIDAKIIKLINNEYNDYYRYILQRMLIIKYEDLLDDLNLQIHKISSSFNIPSPKKIQDIEKIVQPGGLISHIRTDSFLKEKKIKNNNYDKYLKNFDSTILEYYLA